ncbi:protein neprosin-like [Vicia villosa]|uniref:protein neprosin-like n=1 Tax=Vicia villosa TaxID=3911 RepID=UPI00273ADB15|nr:protein neprosin-like [Vicia villosa]
MVTLFFLLCLCLVTGIIGHTIDGRQVNFANESHVKSFMTQSGHIVDCVDIYKQPAFNHPLLKNHKLQRKPSFETDKITSTKPINWLEKVRCPKGTVLIQRITKDDIARGKSLLNNSLIYQDSSPGHEAKVSIQKRPAFYGITGTTSYLYIENANNNLNKILVGWHVFPELYKGSDSTFLFTSWTSDGFKNTGCYNMLCQGFVQTNTLYYLGSEIPRTSVYDGETYEMEISLARDPESKNWFLAIATTIIGYFPGELFSNFDYADGAGWGGKTITPPNVINPQMGSGYFPDKDNFKHGCYFRFIGIRVHDSGEFSGPENVEVHSDVPSCYKVEFYGEDIEEYGYSLQFGGPGGDNCHI